MRLCSRNTGDRVVTVDHAHAGELVIDRLPLEVVVVHVVYMTVDNGFTHVDEEEKWNEWEHHSHPVTRQHDIEHTVALK